MKWTGPPNSISHYCFYYCVLLIASVCRIDFSFILGQSQGNHLGLWRTAQIIKVMTAAPCIWVSAALCLEVSFTSVKHNVGCCCRWGEGTVVFSDLRDLLSLYHSEVKSPKITLVQFDVRLSQGPVSSQAVCAWGSSLEELSSGQLD